MSADFEDWTRGLELVVDDMSDFPDWTVAAQVTGGGGGYASLTGAGQSTTPGDLVQAGDFTINGTNNVFELTPGLIETIGNAGSSIVLTTSNSTGGVTVQSASGQIVVKTISGGSIQLTIAGTSGSIALSTANPGGGSGTNLTMVGTGAGLTCAGQIANEYGTNVGTRGNASFSITDGADPTHATVDFYACNGSPVGVITSQHKGDITFDVGTPGIWISTVAGSSTAWTQYTLP